MAKTKAKTKTKTKVKNKVTQTTTKKEISKEEKEKKELQLKIAGDIIQNDKQIEANIVKLKKDLNYTFYNDEESYEKARLSEHVIHIPASLSLTYMFQCGGAPIGRIIEIGGRPGTFKSTMAIMIGYFAQQVGFNVWYLDIEHKQDVGFLENHGLDVKPADMEDKDLSLKGSVFLRPKRAEDVRKVIAANTASNIQNICYIVDSVSSMQNKYERAHMEKNPDTKKGQTDQRMAAFATYTGQFIKDITPGISESYNMLILVNQMRTKKSGQFYTMDTTGGLALTFHDSSKFITDSIYVQKNSKFQPHIPDPEHPDKYMWKAIQLAMPKTSSGPPIDPQYLFFRLGKGFNKEWELLHLGQKHKFIERDGDGVYKVLAKTSGEIRTCKLGIGLIEAAKFLEKNIKIRNFIEDKLRKKMELPPRKLINDKFKFWREIKETVAEIQLKDKEVKTKKKKSTKAKKQVKRNDRYI